MSEQIISSPRLRPSESERDSSTPCNHRGFGREFVREPEGVIMRCSGCGERVTPASQRSLAA
jgi:hypothetical protein